MTETLKKGWMKVVFGDVVCQIKDRVDIETCGLTEYVRGEHFEPGNLRLIGRSKIGDGLHGSAFHMRFRKGDVLYVSRNPHLRKVAIADFDGICANTTYVCRAKEDYLMQDLLPFVMQTERFVEYTIKNKRGSTNFYLNWSDIASYEFNLPPMEEQRRIANLLICVETVKEKNNDLLKYIDNLNLNLIDTLISNNIYHLKLDDVILEIEYGTSKYSNSIKDGTPVLRIPNVLRGELDLRDIKWVELSADEVNKYRLNVGDILIVRTNGNPLYVGRCIVVPHLHETTVFASYLIRIIVNESIVKPEFVVTMLNSPQVRRQLRTYVKSSAGNYNINTEGLRNIEIPIPNITTQDSFLYNRKLIEQSCLKIIKRNELLDLFKKELIGRFL